MGDLREKVAWAIINVYRRNGGIIDGQLALYMADAAIAAMPAPMSVAEAARVVSDHLINLEESDVWEATQDAMDRPMADAGDIVLAALRALASPEGE